MITREQLAKVEIKVFDRSKVITYRKQYRIPSGLIISEIGGEGLHFYWFYRELAVLTKDGTDLYTYPLHKCTDQIYVTYSEEETLEEIDKLFKLTEKDVVLNQQRLLAARAKERKELEKKWEKERKEKNTKRRWFNKS